MSAATIKEPPVLTQSGRSCSNGRHQVCGRLPFGSLRWTMCRRRRCLAQERSRSSPKSRPRGPSSLGVGVRQNRRSNAPKLRSRTQLRAPNGLPRARRRYEFILRLRYCHSQAVSRLRCLSSALLRTRRPETAPGRMVPDAHLPTVPPTHQAYRLTDRRRSSRFAAHRCTAAPVSGHRPNTSMSWFSPGSRHSRSKDCAISVF